MLILLKKIKDKLTSTFNLTITPSSPELKVRVIKLSFLTPLLLILFLLLSFTTFISLYRYYYSSYLEVKETMNLLQGEIIDSRNSIQSLESTNQLMQKELIQFALETENLKQAFLELQKQKEEIKGLLDYEDKESVKSGNIEQKKGIDLELQLLFNYKPKKEVAFPLGGGDNYNLYQEPKELLKQVQTNIAFIKDKLPGQEKEFIKIEKDIIYQQELLAATPSIWPVEDQGKGYISSGFGWRNDPITSKRAFHEGIDIGVWYNTPVLATAEGKVSYAGWYGGYGWLIKIEHGFAYETYYAHLNRFKVEVGDKVSRGQVIALSGNSGRSTGPHLHYEVRKNNIPQNPREYIER